jgi:CDP-diacylglycerol--glycerol-3-phosphate 3-phosphatidyltransferase
MLFLLAPIPLGTAVLFGVEIPVSHLVALFLFVLAAATDWLDGYYARKWKLVTNFGKFLDPLADKLLVTAALVGLVEIGTIPAWMAIIIISREFAVTGIRLVAASDGAVIAASKLGKWKTVSQIVAIIACLLYNVPFAAVGFPFMIIALWVATILTIVSGVDYFLKNKEFLLKSK